MKKKISTLLFVFSTLIFVVLLAVFIDFVLHINGYQIETNRDILGGLILIYAYGGIVLITSILGLICSIFSLKLASKKAIKICLYVKTVIFSVTTVFWICRLL